MKKTKLLTGLLGGLSLAGIALPIASCSFKPAPVVEVKVFEPSEKNYTAENELQYGTLPESFITIPFTYQGIIVPSKLEVKAEYTNPAIAAAYELYTQVVNMTDNTFGVYVYSLNIDMYSQKPYEFSLTVTYDGKTLVDHSKYTINYQLEFLIPEATKTMYVARAESGNFNYIHPDTFYLCHEPATGAWETPYIQINQDQTDDPIEPDKEQYTLELLTPGKYSLNNMVLNGDYRTTMPEAKAYDMSITLNYGEYHLDEQIKVNVGARGTGYSTAQNPVDCVKYGDKYTFTLSFVKTAQYPYELTFSNLPDTVTDFSNFTFFGYRDDTESGIKFGVETKVSESNPENLEVYITLDKEPEAPTTTSLTLYPIYNGIYSPYCAIQKIYFTVGN